MDLSEICKLGARKYFENRGLYRNPYPHNTPEFNEFERGWTQSLKRDNGRLASESNRQCSGYPEDVPKKATESPSLLAIDAESYRSRKG